MHSLVNSHSLHFLFLIQFSQRSISPIPPLIADTLFSDNFTSSENSTVIYNLLYFIGMFNLSLISTVPSHFSHTYNSLFYHILIIYSSIFPKPGKIKYRFFGNSSILIYLLNRFTFRTGTNHFNSHLFKFTHKPVSKYELPL